MIDGNIQKYEALLKTVELGSFSRAAEDLGYSQSGISRMIQDLERDFGISLLERDRTGVRLTSDGIRLLPFAQSLCREFHRMQEQVDDLNGIQKGLIRIGTISSIASQWLPKIIRHFQEDYPGIDYEILMGDYSEIEEWIAEGRVDCGFTVLPTRAEFYVLTLAQDEMLAVLPKQHAYATAERVPWTIFEKEPFLFLDKGGKSEVADLLKTYNLHPDVRFTTWDDYAIMSLVEQGLGVGILPGLILQRCPYDVVVKPLEHATYRTLGLAMRDMKTASAAMKKFLEYLDYRKE